MLIHDPTHVVSAFSDAIGALGQVASSIDGAPVLVSAQWVGGTAPADHQVVTCDLDKQILSAHDRMALAQPLADSERAAHDLRGWIGAYAPILDRNGARFCFQDGVFFRDGHLTRIFKVEAGSAHLSARGKPDDVVAFLVAQLQRFARLDDGTKSFRNYDHFEHSHTILAGNAESAIAYACLLRPKEAGALRTTSWCEIHPARAFEHRLSELLDDPHV